MLSENSELAHQGSTEVQRARKTARSTFFTALKFMATRLLTVLLTIGLGTFITIVAANGGGAIDNAEKSRINAVTLRSVDPFATSAEELTKLRADMEEKEGLNLPFLPRHMYWTYKALTLNWGEVNDRVKFHPRYTTSNMNAEDSRVILMQYLPNTILLIGAGFFFLFIAGIPFALHLSQNPGGRLDKLIGTLTPLSSIPGWVIGFILILVFAVGLKILPVGRMIDSIPPESSFEYVLTVIRHMVLPVTAILLSSAFTLIFSWRTYFLAYSHEDYVDVGKAMGLPQKTFRRNYILRPVLPAIITSFSLSMVGFWQLITTVEFVFDWPGIGSLFVRALPHFLGERMYPGEIPIIIGTMVIFAYLLGFTVFMLDIAYLVTDPRIRVTSGGSSQRLVAKRTKRKWTFPTFKRPEFSWTETKQNFSDTKAQWAENWKKFLALLSELRGYPSAIIGFSIVGLLVLTSIYTVIALPYRQIGRDWFLLSVKPRSVVPKLALPSWVNFFRENDLPSTILIDSRTDSVERTETVLNETTKTITLTYTFDYPYTEFPKDMVIYYYPTYQEKVPFASMILTTPDGRELELRGEMTSFEKNYEPGSVLNINKILKQNPNWKEWFSIDEHYPTPAFYLLFADPNAKTAKAVPGTYILTINAVGFEKDWDLDAQLVIFGQVYGMAGTDYMRRDLMTPLLWGMPIALIFGLLGSIVITVGSAIVGAAAAWYGGWVDKALQVVIEANMILPVLAVGILLYAFYQVNFWLILMIIILLNIFGSPTKTFRAAFLQVKEASYVEAARAYGATNWRIIWHYLIPRITPVMVPQLIALIPSFAFLEATFAIFNVSEVMYPTWGLVIQNAMKYGAAYGSQFWVLEPISLLLLTGVAFGMSSAAFDYILNPRLRTKG
ncbi:MAG TPA: ABC transporter permease subunit [Anaerolineales bacterium]|nr:ABC transporter permease subunit [Anaerolineales bacterium]